MNDDAAPSNAGPGASLARDAPSRREGSHGGGGGGNGNDSTARDASRARSESPARKRKAGLAKKLQFVTHLMTSLDMVVFAELCALYYMDCSFFRLVIRASSQYLYLTPKSEEFLMLMPANRPHILAVFVPNVICMLLHIVCALPEAGEATRGYLHGGIIIDFVGQKAPASKLALLFFDLVVLALQCFMLSVWVERDKLRRLVYPNRRSTATGSPPEAERTTGSAAAQDLDSEERGVHRDGPGAGDETSGFEMRTFGDVNESPPGEEEPILERHRLLAASTSREGSSSTSMVEVLRSGNAVLADFNVVRAIRTVGSDYQTAAAYPLQLTGYTATLAALAAERRARLESQARQRLQR